MTQGAQQACMGRQGTATTQPSIPVIRPTDGLRQGRPARGACGSARAHGLARGKSRYNGLYHGLGRPLCLNTGRDIGCDTTLNALRYGAQRPATRCKGAATRAAGARFAIQFLYRDQKGQRHGSVRVLAYNDTTTTRQGMACDTTLYAPRHGDQRALCARPRRSAWAECARPGHSACAECPQAGSGCAHCTLDSVLTQCTVLSHCLGHCS